MDKLKIPPQIISALIAMIFCLPSLCFAEGAEHHESPLSGLLILWANFIVFAVILSKATKRPLATFWQARRTAIIEALNIGKTRMQQAETANSSAKEKLAQVTAETARIKTQIAQETVRECEELINLAKLEAARIKERANELSQAEERAFLSSLRTELASQVVAELEKRIKAEWNSEKDKQYRSSTLSTMQNLIN